MEVFKYWVDICVFCCCFASLPSFQPVWKLVMDGWDGVKSEAMWFWLVLETRCCCLPIFRMLATYRFFLSSSVAPYLCVSCLGQRLSAFPCLHFRALSTASLPSFLGGPTAIIQNRIAAPTWWTVSFCLMGRIMLLTEKLALTELYGDGVVQGDSGFEQLLILLMFRSAGRKRGATGLFSSLLGKKKPCNFCHVNKQPFLLCIWYLSALYELPSFLSL